MSPRRYTWWIPLLDPLDTRSDALDLNATYRPSEEIAVESESPVVTQ
jgi:hypothetical protein